MAEQKRVVAKPARIQAESPSVEISKRETWARICYFYPQYTLKTASKLPARDIRLLLKIAEQMEAQRYFNLTQISAAPHTKKGKGVKDLSDHFKQMMKN